MRRARLPVVVATVVVVAVVVVAVTGSDATDVDVTEPAQVAGLLEVGAPSPDMPRDLDAYHGLGTWVDAFDFADGYAGGAAPLTPDAVDDMAARGVRTVFVQAVRWDADDPEGVVDRLVLRDLLIRAHSHQMRVVGWYLPEFDDVDADLARVQTMLDLELSGHRLDGIGIDIEWTEAVPDHAERSDRLVELSRGVDAIAGDVPVAAIVLPAVQIEVVNEHYWPQFPYQRIAPSYDVWMPMAYWSFRGEPYDDGYRYVAESVDRLRNNLDDPDARVAPIGGIADAIDDAHVVQFAQSLADVGAVGGSFYDWNTLTDARAVLIQEAFETGPARSLPSR